MRTVTRMQGLRVRLQGLRVKVGIGFAGAITAAAMLPAMVSAPVSTSMAATAQVAGAGWSHPEAQVAGAGWSAPMAQLTGAGWSAPVYNPLPHGGGSPGPRPDGAGWS